MKDEIRARSVTSTKFTVKCLFIVIGFHRYNKMTPLDINISDIWMSGALVYRSKKYSQYQ